MLCMLQIPACDSRKRGQDFYGTNSELEQIIQQTQNSIQALNRSTTEDDLIQVCMKRSIVTV